MTSILKLVAKIKNAWENRHCLAPESFPLANVTFGKPANWDEDRDGSCGGLPACILGGSEIVSCWKAPWYSRVAFLFHGRIWCHIYSSTQPPMALTLKRSYLSIKLDSQK